MRYQQVCPVSPANDVIAERWTPQFLPEFVFLGARRVGEIQRGIADGAMRLDGPPALVRGFLGWLRASHSVRDVIPGSPAAPRLVAMEAQHADAPVPG
jgi:hypothetical protein